jgi:hypothetical protein
VLSSRRRSVRAGSARTVAGMLHTSNASTTTTRLRSWTDSQFSFHYARSNLKGEKHGATQSQPALPGRAYGISERLRRTGGARPPRNRSDENTHDSGPPALAHDVLVAVMPSRRKSLRMRGLPGGLRECKLLSSSIGHGSAVPGLLVERTAWTFGLVCLVTCGALYIDGTAGARHERDCFALLQAAALQQPPPPDLSLRDVDPEDVPVLDATRTRSLTLVTCYPFYYVGPAPQRYIVRAVRADTAAPVSAAGEQVSGVRRAADRQSAVCSRSSLKKRA